MTPKKTAAKNKATSSRKRAPKKVISSTDRETKISKEATEEPAKKLVAGPRMVNSSPQIILEIDNSSDSMQKVKLFTQYEAENNERVFIKSMYDSIKYEHIVKQIAVSSLQIGCVYFKTVSGSMASSTNIVRIISRSLSGELFMNPLIPIIDAYQFQSGISYTNLRDTNKFLDVETEWEIEVPSKTVVQVRFFISAITSLLNLKKGNNIEHSNP